MKESEFSHGKCQYCKRGISDNEYLEFDGKICYTCSLMFPNYKEGECLFCHGKDLLMYMVAELTNLRESILTNRFKEYWFCVQCAVNKLNFNEEEVRNMIRRKNNEKADSILRKLKEEGELR